MQISGDPVDTYQAVPPNTVRSRHRLWRSRSLNQLGKAPTCFLKERNLREPETSDRDSWCSALTDIYIQLPHSVRTEITTGISTPESGSSDSFHTTDTESRRIRAPLEQAQEYHEHGYGSRKSGESIIIDAITYNILASTIGADILAYYGYDWGAVALMVFMVVSGLLEGCYGCAEYLNQSGSSAAPRIERRWFHTPCEYIHRIFNRIGQGSSFMHTSAEIFRTLYRPICLTGSLGTGCGDFIQHTYNGFTRTHCPDVAEICSSLAIIVPVVVAVACYLYGYCRPATSDGDASTTNIRSAAGDSSTIGLTSGNHAEESSPMRLPVALC